MSGSKIKAGEAYVTVGMQDQTAAGLKKLDGNFQSTMGAIQKYADNTAVLTANAAVKASSDAIKAIRTQQKDLEAQLKKSAKTADPYGMGPSAAHKALLQQQIDLTQQLAAAEAQKATAQQAAATAAESYDRQYALRIARAREAVELAKQEHQIRLQANAAGTGAVGAALASGANAHRLGSVSSTSEADKLTRSLTTQRDLVHSQTQALMEQLRTMRAAGATQDAQTPVMQAIRSHVAERTQLETQINHLATVRMGLKARELSAEELVTEEKTRQAALDQAELDRRQKMIDDGKVGQAVVGAAMGAGAGAHAVNRLSTVEESKRFEASLRDQQSLIRAQILALTDRLRIMRQSGASQEQQIPVEQAINAQLQQRVILEGQVNKTLQLRDTLDGAATGFTKSGGKAQMALQQLIFAADDAASSFGTGGVAGAVRGASNNLTMVASLLMAPVGFGLVVATMAAIQLAFAFNKSKTATEEQTDALKELNEELGRLDNRIDHQVQLGNIDSANEAEGHLKSLKTDQAKLDNKVAQREDILAKEMDDQQQRENEIQAHRDAVAEIASQQISLVGVPVMANVNNVNEQAAVQMFAHQQEITRLLKEQEESEKRKPELQKQINEKLKERQELMQSIADAEAVVADFADEAVHNEAAERQDKFRARAKELYDQVQSERDPFLARRNEIHGERAKRLKELEEVAPGDVELRGQINQSFDRKLSDHDKQDPARLMMNQLNGEISSLAGQRQQIGDQYRNRMSDLDRMAEDRPEDVDQIELLRRRTRASTMTQIMQMENAQPASNQAVEANSAGGLSAIFKALNGSSSTEDKMLQTLLGTQRLEQKTADGIDQLIRNRLDPVEITVERI